MIQTFVHYSFISEHAQTLDLNFLMSLVLEADTTKDADIEELQKQINDIVQELNVLKEQQALQTGTLFTSWIIHFILFTLVKECN